MEVNHFAGKLGNPSLEQNVVTRVYLGEINTTDTLTSGRRQ